MRKFIKIAKRGFTIVELVIVIAVIAVLAGVLIPTFGSVVENAKYSSALQEATNQFKADNMTYMAQGYGEGVPDGILYESNGYYFVSDDGHLTNISEEKANELKGNNPHNIALEKATTEYNADVELYNALGLGDSIPNNKIYSADGFYFVTYNGKLIDVDKDEVEQIQINNIKNIIFLIPDGAGFGTYDIANKLKLTTGSGVSGQATPITHDAINGMTVDGLYLDEFMIAAADTWQYYGEADGPTDSTAAGTALLGGYKTNYLVCGLDHEANARANLLELARLMGKSSGFVTTKCLIDATPCAGNVHLLRRPDQKADYQADANKQYMVNGVDLLLAYGTDGGYYRNGVLIENSLKARDYGFTLVSDLTTLNSVVNGGATKVFSNILNDCEGDYSGYVGTDYQANHVKYDVHATYGTDLTLMDMAKAGLKVMINNNNENGYVLCIEGGAIDNAAEGRNVKEAVGDYLAFDEVFAYCVNYAKLRGDTVVIACPDHDSGGFYSDPNGNAPVKANSNGNKYDTMDDVISALADGTMANKTVLAGAVTGHSGQNVPCWLYAPEYVRAAIITKLGIPQDTNASKVRTGNYYDQTVINSNYKINNSDISPAILSALGWMSLDTATEELFYQINLDNTFGSYDVATETFTFTNGETIIRDTNYWTDTNGVKHDFSCGYALYVTNASDDAYGDGKFHVTPVRDPGTYPNRFYVPKDVLIEMGYLNN